MIVELISIMLAQPSPADAKEKALVPFPHPLITEVLYAVPTKEGDADQDGKRSATGDEFIELVNPHNQPINLKGYVLSDASSQSIEDESTRTADQPRTNMPYPKDEPSAKPKEADKPVNPGGGVSKPAKKTDQRPARKDSDSDARIRFVFPDLTLQPGEVVVVFNGFESQPVGPVGTTSTAAKKNEKFHNAYVLTMRAKSKFVALSNAGDYVLLTDPKGAPVECVHWGNRELEKGLSAPLDERAPESKVSVQRKGIRGAFVEHSEITPGEKFSPGKFESK